MGGFLHSGHFWWAAIAAILMPAILALLVVAGLVMLLARRRIWAGVNGVLVILMFLLLIPFTLFGSHFEPDDGDLILMTFSVPRFGDTVEGLAEDVFNLLEQEHPDVIVLQETAAWHQLDEPDRPFIADYVQPSLDSLGYVLAIPDRLEGRRTPLPVLTREGGPTVLAQREGSLADDPLASRYLRTHIEWRDREAILYNVHLRGYGAAKPWEEARFPLVRPRDWLPFLRRYRSAFRQRAAEVRDLRGRLDAEELPVVLAGDLNVTPQNWDYRQLSRSRTDAFRAAGRGWGGTYRGDLPLVRIDFVLVDRDFDVVAAHVPKVQFSDHRPVVARIRWRGGGE
jgi:endonuclease/exonuclease/phosphatase (EEP) superfamily protein YafD